MNKAFIALGCVVALSGVSVLAQPVAAETPSDPKSVGPRLNVGGSLTQGNGDNQTLNTEIVQDGSILSGNEISIGAAYNFGKANENKIVDNARVFGGIRRTIQKPFYVYGKVDAFSDEVAGIDYRITPGPGVGTYLRKDEKTELGVEVGLVWIAEKTSSHPQGNETSLAARDNTEESFAPRAAQNFKRALSKTSRIWESVERLPSFHDFGGDYLVNAEVGVESDLVKGISLRVVAKDAYDSVPAPGREGNDMSVSAGLGIQL